jgi:hypothetical protein
VFAFFFEPTQKPCIECGAPVELAAADEHACDAEQRLDYWMFRLRHELAAFETDFQAWLGSSQGRFAAWQARRTR